MMTSQTARVSEAEADTQCFSAPWYRKFTLERGGQRRITGET